MGLPMMSAKALPSKRVDAYLAGITAVIFMWLLIGRTAPGLFPARTSLAAVEFWWWFWLAFAGARAGCRAAGAALWSLSGGTYKVTSEGSFVSRKESEGRAQAVGPGDGLQLRRPELVRAQ